MRKERTLTEEYLECDGCQYLMSESKPMVTVSVPFDYPVHFLRDDRMLEFHFHAIQARHDCFRYWAHNPRIMEQSLKARDLDQEEIDEFMSMMLYRQSPFSPGIEREKAS